MKVDPKLGGFMTTDKPNNPIIETKPDSFLFDNVEPKQSDPIKIKKKKKL